VGYSCLAESNQSQQASGGDVLVSSVLDRLLFPALLDVLADEEFMEFLRDGGREVFGQGDVGPQEVWPKHDLRVIGRLLQLVDLSDVFGNGEVLLLLGVIGQHEDEVEPGEQGCGEVDVLVDGFVLVVPAEEGVGGGEDGGAGVERGGDAGLGDGDGLLLHHLVDGRPVVLLHLVELVDAADPHVRQHQRTRLQRQLLRVRVDHDRRSQPHARTALPRRVDCPRRQVGDVLQQLRLCDSGVADQSNVDFPPDLEVVVGFLGDSAGHEQQERLFDPLHAVYFRRDGAGHAAEESVLVEAGADALDLVYLALRQRHLHVLLLLADDLQRLQVALEGQLVLVPEPQSPLRQQDALDEDDVPGSGLFGAGLLESKCEGPGDASVP
jgi:hypothetical protein